MKKLLAFLILVGACYGQTTYSQIQGSSFSANWSLCSTLGCPGGGTPGGAGSATSFTQTLGTTSTISLTGTAFANGLATWKNTIASTATVFSTTFTFQLSTTNIQAFEFDEFKFIASTRNYMFGHQCNFATHLYEVFNQSTDSWVATTLACTLDTNQHTITTREHINGNNMVYDSITIDGQKTDWNLSYPSSTTTFGNAIGTQFQLDLNGTATPASVQISNVTFTAFPASATVSAPNPGVYGNAFQGSGGLANLEIGKFAGRKIDIRFIANYADIFTGPTLYMKTGVGYSAGTGGTVKVALQADDGTANHFASGIDLDSVSAQPGNPASPTFRYFSLIGGIASIPGTIYHYVITNTDADPVNNYVSLDDMGMDTNTAPPYYSGSPVQLNCSSASCFGTLAILWQNTAPPWAVKTNHFPIASLNYMTNAPQGAAYVDQLVSSGLFTIQGANQAGELLTPTTTQSASGINLWIKKTGTPGPLTVALQTSTGTPIESVTIPASSIGTNYSWVNSAFSTTRPLTVGTSYRTILSSAADVSNNYQVFPMQKGQACCGMSATSTPSGTNYQTNTGSGWNNFLSSTSYDMPMFLTTPGTPTSGIIDPGRAMDWTQAGVPGGIPTTRTQCGSPIAAYSGSASTINTAANSCSANTYVKLDAGIFSLTSGIKVTTSNVSVVGSGANSTFLVFANGAGCGLGGQSGSICGVDTLAIYNGNPQVLPPNGIRQMTWTAGYAQGTTSITLNSCGAGCVPPTSGMMLILDQADDTTDTSGIYVCSSASTCNAEGATNAVGRTIGGVRYSQQQIVKITSISGSGTGPYTVNFTPGLYATNWGKAGGKGAWWSNNVQGIGFENFSADYSANTGTGFGITLYDCYGCWVKGVRGMQPNGQAHVLMYQSAHATITDSYFYGSPGAQQSYGTEFFETTDNLVQNNIFQQVASPSAPGNYSGSVFAYNFSIYNKFINNNWMQVTYSAHNTAGMLNLYEGNYLNGLSNDDDWGTAPLNTYFRNRLVGVETVSGLQRSQNTIGTRLDWGSRGFNIIGNVYGTSPFDTTYEVSSGSTTNCYKAIFVLGYRSVGSCSAMSSGANDPLVKSTLMRWGNYDTVNAAVRWDATESAPAAAGSGATILNGNTQPASHTLPASFYLAAAPSFFGTVPYPPIGPDVTGGNISGVGGFANRIPAQNCYLSLPGATSDGTGAALAFDPSLCYASGIKPRTGGVLLKGVLIK